jgi:anaerobic selenocysteine-containing dehydrogenase
MGDGTGANKPWLQETPDPMTTVMWNSWVEINPQTAEELGIKDDDVVRIVSPFGEIEASVYQYPAIRPDVVAIPFGQGHITYGRYAAGRGSNPLHLLPVRNNGAGDLTFEVVKVRIEKTGKSRPLARKESKLGVYGE